MTQEHPITPPPELVEQWLGIWPQDALMQASRWGADQELEACRNWLRHEDVGGCGLTADWLYEARRPKPPSLKEQALKALKNIDDACESEGFSRSDDTDIIRCALESLPD